MDKNELNFHILTKKSYALALLSHFMYAYEMCKRLLSGSRLSFKFLNNVGINRGIQRVNEEWSLVSRQRKMREPKMQLDLSVLFFLLILKALH